MRISMRIGKVVEIIENTAEIVMEMNNREFELEDVTLEGLIFRRLIDEKDIELVTFKSIFDRK